MWPLDSSIRACHGSFFISCQRRISPRCCPISRFAFSRNSSKFKFACRTYELLHLPNLPISFKHFDARCRNRDIVGIACPSFIDCRRVNHPFCSSIILFLDAADFISFRFVDGSFGFVSGQYVSKKGRMTSKECVLLQITWIPYNVRGFCFVFSDSFGQVCRKKERSTSHRCRYQRPSQTNIFR